ncbi:condensation domain-containing protein [uncultured Williamsia sp.]|uniref:condensation domain-containing protein n=1 Tax=uncultured Williamsia sp. TaxID=259311 RepID=UPI00260FFA25|nr:condensation domain-containing protein [uncultured Williamsia sp.]
MEFTELTDYPLTGGVLTEWVPRPAARPGARGWVDDARPLTPIHADYCRRGVEVFDPRAGTDDAPSGSWLGAVFEVPHRHDTAALRAALTAWMQRHEVFATTVREEHGHLRRGTLADDVVVTPAVVGSLRTGTRVHEHLVAMFERLSPMRWPHCLVATIAEPAVEHAPLTAAPRRDDRFLLVFGADHSVMDAYSMLLAIGEIQDLYRRALAGEPIDRTPIGSHVDFSVADHAAAAALHLDHPAVRAWHEFLRHEDGRFPAFPLPIHDDSPRREGRQSGVSSWVMTAGDADALNAGVRGRGHTMQTLVLTALAGATARVSGSSRTRFVMPLHTRTDPRHRASMGWFVGMVPVDIDTGTSRGVDDRLAAVADEVTRRRPLAPLPYPRVAELLGSDTTPRFVVSYVDCRRIPGADDWARWGARTLRGASTSGDEVYLWIVRSPSGISVSARFPSTPVATDAVHRYLHALHETISDLAVDLGVADRLDRRRRSAVRSHAALTPGGLR